MQQDQTNDLGLALVNTVATDNLGGAATSLLDALLTPALEAAAKVGEGVPVFGVLVSLFKAGVVVNQQIFVRKLARFLLELEKVSLREREEFVKELKADPKLQQKVGEDLILLIDRLDSMEKANLVSRLFGFVVDKTIDYDTYRRVAILVDRAHLPDLLALVKFKGGHSISEPDFSKLEIDGLASIGATVGPVNVINEAAESGDSSKSHLLSAGLTTVGRQLYDLLMKMEH